MPSPPCWLEQLGNRALWKGRVLLPCAGLDAPGEAMRKLQWPVKCAGLWDVSTKVAQVWAGPLRPGLSRECLHLGPVAGDIMKVSDIGVYSGRGSPHSRAAVPPVEQHGLQACCMG